MPERLPRLGYLKPEILQKLGDLELIAREVVEGLRVGSHRSSLRGFSTEFAHHRPYAPGDAIRDLDWRVYGRTDRFYTRLYEAETNFDCYILMDASSSMTYASGEVSKLEYSKYLAATLAYLILNQRDSVGLSVFDSEVRAYLPPRSTMGVIVQIEQLLRDIEPTPKSSIAKQLHDIALQIKRRSLVIVISDLLSDVDDIQRGLDHLRFDGHNVVVFHTLDPHELEFPFKGTWRFDGLESDEEVVTQPERIRDEYLENLSAFLESLRAGCIGGQVDYTMVSTSRPLDTVLTEFLQRRSSNLMGASMGGRP
jgi:uncharacterized protein (DUF58 family)